MFGIGIFELLIVLVVAVIAIGPEKLPGMMKAFGKAYTEFRRAGEELKRGIAEPVREKAGGLAGMVDPNKAPEARPAEASDKTRS